MPAFRCRLKCFRNDTASHLPQVMGENGAPAVPHKTVESRVGRSIRTTTWQQPRNTDELTHGRWVGRAFPQTEEASIVMEPPTLATTWEASPAPPAPRTLAKCAGGAAVSTTSTWSSLAAKPLPLCPTMKYRSALPRRLPPCASSSLHRHWPVGRPSVIVDQAAAPSVH